MKYEFMERLEDKLRNKAEQSAESLKEKISKDLEKERQQVAKDIYNIFTQTGSGNPQGEMGHIFRHKGDGGGVFFGIEEE